TEMPAAIEADAALLARFQAVRQAASVAMGLTHDLEDAARIKSVPKVAMVTTPRAATTLSGAKLTPRDMDITVPRSPVGRPQRAAALPCAMSHAVATLLTGTLPAHGEKALSADTADMRIGHASGASHVDAKVMAAGPHGPAHAVYASVYRTA